MSLLQHAAVDNIWKDEGCRRLRLFSFLGTGLIEAHMLIHLKWQLLFDLSPPAAVKWQIWEKPECDLTVPSVVYHCSCFSRHHLLGILLHKIFAVIPICASDCNVPVMTPNLVKQLSGMRAGTTGTFLPLQSLKVNVSQLQSSTSTVWLLDLRGFFVLFFLKFFPNDTLVKKKGKKCIMIIQVECKRRMVWLQLL